MTAVHPLRLLWTQAGYRNMSAFADAAKVSRRTLSQIERDGTVPTDSILTRLASVLPVDAVELYRVLREHAAAQQAQDAETAA